MIDRTTLPKEKQTTLGLYVTAAEAYEKWQAAPETVKVLDVRTPEEFVFVGHPTMAWNVPIALPTHQVDAAKKQLVMQPAAGDFLARVSQIAKPDDTLLVTCRSGGRSAMAVNLLAKAGFNNAYTIVDGIEGDTIEDPENVYRGKRMKNGWKNSNLPWTYDLDPEKMLLPVASGVTADDGR